VKSRLKRLSKLGLGAVKSRLKQLPKLGLGSDLKVMNKHSSINLPRWAWGLR